MSTLYMFDTNTVSYLIRGKSRAIKQRLNRVSMNSICISAITEAELLRGVARRPEATTLARVVDEFLVRTEVLPWDSAVAATYAQFRTLCGSEGKSLATMDMLIASHAVAVGATLVSNDNAFSKISHHLPLEDWTA